jgi:hypothetical protein
MKNVRLLAFFVISSLICIWSHVNVTYAHYEIKTPTIISFSSCMFLPSRSFLSFLFYTPTKPQEKVLFRSLAVALAAPAAAAAAPPSHRFLPLSSLAILASS